MNKFTFHLLIQILNIKIAFDFFKLLKKNKMKKIRAILFGMRSSYQTHSIIGPY